MTNAEIISFEEIQQKTPDQDSLYALVRPRNIQDQGLAQSKRLNDLIDETNRSVQSEKRKARPDFRGRVTGPVQVFDKILQIWGLSENEGATLLGLENRLFLDNLLSGVTTLRSRDMKDRIRILFEIHDALSTLYQNEQAEKNWIHGVKKELEGKSPLEIMLEGSLENLLLVKQYVEWISGR